jgi:hypothetical protein
VIQAAGVVQRWLASGLDRVGAIGAALGLAALIVAAALLRRRRRI